MLRMADRLPQSWEIDYEDLGNVYGRARIQSCNACVSTSMALCVWPCDAWAFIGPINWYGPASSLKLMCDRLVCMSGGNPREDLIDHKDPERAMRLELSPEWRSLSLNHLEGRTAGFFCYGDEGANEVGEDGRPVALRHEEWFDPERESLYRAFGYRPPGHRLADLRLKWREWRMGLGLAPKGSSPAEQEALDLNRDATLRPKRSEGERLRE